MLRLADFRIRLKKISFVQEKLWKFELDLRQKEDELRRAEDSRRADELTWEKERQRMNRSNLNIFSLLFFFYLRGIYSSFITNFLIP